MTDKRINDNSLTLQTTFNPDYRLLSDYTGLAEAKPVKFSILGNTYIQGATASGSWTDQISVTHTRFRITTDGGSTWRLLDTDLIPESTTNLYLTSTERTNISNNTTNSHTHSNKAILDNIIDSGSGLAFLSDDGTYNIPSAFSIYTDSSITGDGSSGDPFSIVESDPIYLASQAANITASDITNLGNLSGVNTGDDSTSITGIVKGNGSVFSAALDGTDYLSPTTVQTEIDKNNYLREIMSTSIIDGMTLSINADTSKFDISSGVVRFVDNYTDINNPIITTITYSGSTANTLTDLATEGVTYIYIDESETLTQVHSILSGADLRTKVLIRISPWGVWLTSG